MFKNQTSHTMTQSISDKFVSEFRPFSLFNIDEVLAKVQFPDSPFLAKFSWDYTFKIGAIFSAINLFACTIFFSTMNIDAALQFLSTIFTFVFISGLFGCILVYIHKLRMDYFFTEVSEFTQEIKRTFFYNQVNFNLILQDIPLSLQKLEPEKLAKLKDNCRKNTVSNKDVQSIFNMLHKEPWLEQSYKASQIMQTFIEKTISINKKN